MAEQQWLRARIGLGIAVVDGAGNSLFLDRCRMPPSNPRFMNLFPDAVYRTGRALLPWAL